MKLNNETKEKIYELLNSDIVNYLETSERLVFKNALEKNLITDSEDMKLRKIIKKYDRFAKN